MRVVALALALLVPGVLQAQDSTQSGVRVGITYTPGTRPTAAVVGRRAPTALDSVRVTLEKDLDQSDRFEMMPAPGPGTADSLLRGAVLRGVLANLVVMIDTAGGSARISAMDGQAARTVYSATLPLSGGWRRATHRVADAIVEAVFGQAGIASTRLLLVRSGRIWRVDADGGNAMLLRTAGFPSLSPAWSPDARRFAYTAFVRAGQPIVIQDFASGARDMIPGTEYGMNITPVFSADGRRIAFAHGSEAGTDIYISRAAGNGWGRGEAVTSGRFADNLSPVWSPDGSRIAFISNRARSPQLYVMSADGTGQEVLARFDFGATGQSSAPSWSPDGGLIAFHREVGGDPQLFVFDVASRQLRQLTGSGRNEDPSWAPDSRHLAFVSSRGGRREVWILDLETGRLRQLTTGGGARLPAWSPRLPNEDR